MSIKRRIITLLLILYLPIQLAAQHPAIDAYNNRFTAQRTIETLNNIEKQEHSSDELLLIHSLKALTYITNKNYTSAKQELEVAEQYKKKPNVSVEQGYFYYAQGRLYDIYEISDDALKAFLESYTIFKKVEMPDIASEVAVFIYNTSNADNDPKYLKEALALANQSGDLSAIINARNAYANYIKYLELPKENPDYGHKRLIEYLKETFNLIKDESNVKNKFYLCSLYFNYGYNLLYFNNDKSGNAYLDKALSLAKTYQFKSIIRNYYGAKGSILEEQGKYDEAKTFYQNGLQEIKQIPFVDHQTELLFYNHLKMVAEKQRDWQAYYQFDTVCQKLNASLNDENKQKAVQAALAKYEWREKEEKIQLLSSKTRFQRYLIGSLVFVVLLLLAAGYLYWKNQKLRWKLLTEKNQLLEADKTNTQKELLNSVLHLEKKNEILNDIKNTLLEKNKETPKLIHQNIFKIIDDGILMDDDFNKFKENFNPIYPDFFNNLQLKAHHTLTQLDLKYCAFILMRLSNKEIALQMNVEPKSIRMARYRIKQKLNLGKEEDLDSFIINSSNT